MISISDIEVKRLENLPADFVPRYCKHTQAGSISEFLEMKSKPKPIDCVRVSADCYVRPSEGSGELHEYIHALDKSGCKDSVRRSLSALRLLINANCSCVDPARLSWVTLTYAENMTDTKKLYSDFKAFWMRFGRWCIKQGYAKPEYIAVCEPQGRGAWHLHCLWIWPDKAPFIENNAVLWPMWGHGFTKIKAVRTDCDNLGAYFSAYLADMTADEFSQAFGYDCPERFTEEKQVISEDGSEVPKRIVKGARLKLYPVGMNIYRASKGIVRPVSEVLTTEQAQTKKASAGTLTFSVAVAVSSVDGSGGVQIISKSYYNRNRVKCQDTEGV